jgi:hypothetical protein
MSIFDLHAITFEDSTLGELYQTFIYDYPSEIARRPSNGEYGKKIQTILKTNDPDYFQQAFELSVTLEPEEKGLIALVYKALVNYYITPLESNFQDWSSQPFNDNLSYRDNYLYFMPKVYNYVYKGKVISSSEVEDMVAEHLGMEPYALFSQKAYKIDNVTALEGTLLIDYDSNIVSGELELEAIVKDETGIHQQEFIMRKCVVDNIDVRHAIDMSDVVIDEDNLVQRNLFSLSIPKDAKKTLEGSIMTDKMSYTLILELNFLDPNGMETYSGGDVEVRFLLDRL